MKNNTINKYKRKIKKDMIDIKVYKPQFDKLIEIYAGLLVQYETLEEKFIENDYNLEVPTERGGGRKSALVTSLESLRRDLVLYSDRLMLNPKSLQKAELEIKGKPSKLATALNKLGKDIEK